MSQCYVALLLQTSRTVLGIFNQRATIASSLEDTDSIVQSLESGFAGAQPSRPPIPCLRPCNHPSCRLSSSQCHHAFNRIDSVMPLVPKNVTGGLHFLFITFYLLIWCGEHSESLQYP